MSPDPERPVGFVVTGEKKQTEYLLTGMAFIGERTVRIPGWYRQEPAESFNNPVSPAPWRIHPVMVPNEKLVYAERRNGDKGL